MSLRVILLAGLVAAGSVVAWQSFHRSKTEPGFVAHPAATIKLDPETPEFDDAIAADLAGGHYDRLDAMAADFRRPEARFVSGIPKLEVFYGRLTRYARIMTADGPVEASLDAPDFDDFRVLLENWHRSDPKSSAASIALVKLWELHAWDARQHGFTSSVTEARWALVEARLQMAERYLIDPDPAEDPVVLYEATQIGALRGYGRDRMEALYQRAVAAFPWYYPYYAQHAIFIERSWFGQPGEARRYLEGLRRPENGPDGQIEYSFAAYRLMQHYSYQEMYRDTGLDFPKVIEAFQTREALYGLRDKDWNAIFYLSVPGRDCETMHVALQQFGERWEPEIWYDRHFFDDTVAWFHAGSRY